MQRTQNKFIADHLREAASLLEQQGANPFRVNAYRRAASTVESLDDDISVTFGTGGLQAFTTLPGIGRSIGGAIVEMLRSGQWTQLERLRGALDPEALFGRVRGIGTRLSGRIVNELHVDTLEGLETAVHDGRLAKVRGFGSGRLAIVRLALAEMLGRKRWSKRTDHQEPPVNVLLGVDQEYREKAAAEVLQKIAPRRFNLSNQPWLPVLHTERGLWQFTVVYSNTALAHELGRTRDWVVIYFHTNSCAEGQRTVVTETHGLLHGRRVVRGRERDCEDYYAPPLFRSPSVA